MENPDEPNLDRVEVEKDAARAELGVDKERVENELSNEKKKRRTKPLVVGLIILLVAILGEAATLAVYKLYFEKSPADTTVTSKETKKRNLSHYGLAM